MNPLDHRVIDPHCPEAITPAHSPAQPAHSRISPDCSPSQVVASLMGNPIPPIGGVTGSSSPLPLPDPRCCGLW